jgi:hypothetical protein
MITDITCSRCSSKTLKHRLAYIGRATLGVVIIIVVENVVNTFLYKKKKINNNNKEIKLCYTSVYVARWVTRVAT